MGIKAGKVKKGKKSNTLKVLILGISGSGKSTFTKQMIVIHQGFSTYEEERYKSILHQNVLIGIQELVKYTDKLELKVSNENRKTARYFIEMIVLEEVLDEKLAQKVKKIWNDPAIQNAWVMAPQMQLQMNNMEYLISNLDRMCLPDYKPSVEDILQARQRTTGQQTTTFTKDKYTWELIDVGGQRPEREKWENIIQHTQLHAVIYFAGLDEYNMNSSEAQGKTKMAISMQVWEEVLHTIEKHQICLLLFLNKMDLFEKKIKNESDFNDFKTILGYSGPQDADECSKFLARQIFSNYSKNGILRNTCTCDMRIGYIRYYYCIRGCKRGYFYEETSNDATFLILFILNVM